MKRLIVILATLLVVGGIAFYGGFVSKQEPYKGNIPVRITYQKVATYCLYFIAQEKGYFKDEGLDVEMIPISSGEEAVDALVANRADVAHNPVVTLFNLECNIPGKFKIIELGYTDLSSDTETFRLIVREDSDIRTLADLKGKKLGTPPSKSQEVMVRLFLKNFFDTKDITLICLPIKEQIAAVQSGSVDAVMAMEPAGTAALLKGGFREIDSTFSRAKYVMNPLYGAAVSVSTDFIKKFPGGEKRMMRVLEKAIKFRYNHEEEARFIIGKHTGYPSEIVKKIHLTGEQLSSEADKSTLQKLADLYLEHNLLKGRINIESILLD